ncbi:hypothetical protein ECH_1030 [Ehrlichia chaffeensis str. Arkansas]|uniref:Uncharacterized protein n=1 Tax=Ehrlichia chaffeensis (strain ATCC CRL-10679 / Arkansas) TaxID=205920 RepID=Q2GFG7_EHRCR|nr:hypothetical protein [Ehrlichia chaffeensis]ABD45245.1 hypothetical protein ECH_1030 [Ehrlichia chaffeensis str. Arkansas]
MFYLLLNGAKCYYVMTFVGEIGMNQEVECIIVRKETRRSIRLICNLNAIKVGYFKSGGVLQY